MRVLVACEFSGRVRDAFIERGHDAWSCDLLFGEGLYKERHYYGDVRKVLGDGWDLMIAHPPCTYLANSGIRWLKYGGPGMLKMIDCDRWDKMVKAARFFKLLLRAPIPKIAIENPIMHHYALKQIGREYSQLIQPWEHGDGETKGTCLWLKGLPCLLPSRVVKGRYARTHLASGKDQKRIRSITPKGIAKAMATQWSA